MKITSKTLMVSVETEVKLGNNDAIELTLQHQAFIYENKFIEANRTADELKGRIQSNFNSLFS